MTSRISALSVSSPVGPLTVYATADAVVRLGWEETTDPRPSPLLQDAVGQLSAYFAGNLTRFDLPLAPVGSSFRMRVWQAMSAIPFGGTATYGDIAKSLNTAARAVGGACADNPVPIIIPCHRVVASNGALGGYSGKGGIKTKTLLLEHEHALV